MSAELFLSSRLESAHALYGPIVDLTDQIHDLSHLDVLPAVQQHVEILWADLKAWWAAHPSHADLALFDSMSQLHDLACGESAVWLQTLTEDLVEHLRASLNQAPQQMTLLIDLGKQIYHLAHQRVEEQIPEVIWQLYEQIARLDAPTDGISTETSIRDTRPQLDAHLWGTISSHFALAGEGSIKEALEHMDAVLAGERTAALRMLAQEFLQMVKKQQDHALPLDVHISELAHTLALQMAIPEASAFCDAFAHWQTVIQCAYDALQTVGEELVAEHRLQESTVKGAEDLWDTQTVEAAEAVQISLMAVKEQLPWNEVPLAPEVRLWTDLATQLITRWIVMQMEGKLLTALVSFSDDLTTGTGKLWLKMMANRLLEAFRPPLPDRTALLPDALLLEPEDDRPTASAWKQIALLAYEGAKRDQEHEVDDINAPLFHLAVQLRDLIDGRSDSRIRVLVRNLVEQLQGADFLQEQTRQSLLTCAMETADLVEKSPLRRLRALLPSIVAQLSELPVEAAEAPSQGKKSDTPALFSLARKVQALAEEQVAEELALLWESVQLQIDTLEADPRVDDPDLLALLRQIPQGLSPLNLEVLQETLHQILPALGSRLRPEDGYFRDFYNGTNILLMLGMDWWRDVLPRMNVETNELPLSGVHWLYQRVCEANLELPTEALWRRIAQQGIRVDEEGDHSRAAWIERFQQRKEQLQTLLKRAIDLEEPLICSF